jgi:hypothetical protein
MKVINSIFNTPYNWSLATLSVIIFYLLISPYNATANYDMFASFYNYVTLISAGVYLVVLNLKGADKTLRQSIISLSAANILMSILTVLLVKSLMIPDLFGMALSAVSTFMFLLLLKHVNLLALKD